MKIVAHSNFDHETVDEFVVADNITSTEYATIILDALQNSATDYSTYYFKLVPDDYKLYKWEP